MREKEPSQLKSRFNRISGPIQKFVGCYSSAFSAINEKKSGTSDNDIMDIAHAFFSQDDGAPFNLEYAWRLLKDEPK